MKLKQFTAAYDHRFRSDPRSSQVLPCFNATTDKPAIDFSSESPQAPRYEDSCSALRTRQMII